MKKKYLLSVLILSCFVLIAACGTLGQQKEKFTVSLNSPQVPIGEFETQFSTFMSLAGLKKDSVKVLYFPREDAVCLQYRRDFTTYHQFWSYPGRQSFITALEQYNADYEERNLDTKNRRTIRNYSVVEGYLYWQMASFTVQAKANVNVEIGYQFRDNSPYFSIHQREAEYKEEMTRDHNRTSTAITMYFTRAQAAELAALFDQSFLQTMLSPRREAIGEEIEADKDTY